MELPIELPLYLSVTKSNVESNSFCLIAALSRVTFPQSNKKNSNDKKSIGLRSIYGAMKSNPFKWCMIINNSEIRMRKTISKVCVITLEWLSHEIYFTYNTPDFFLCYPIIIYKVSFEFKLWWTMVQIRNQQSYYWIWNHRLSTQWLHKAISFVLCWRKNSIAQTEPFSQCNMIWFRFSQRSSKNIKCD